VALNGLDRSVVDLANGLIGGSTGPGFGVGDGTGFGCGVGRGMGRSGSLSCGLGGSGSCSGIRGAFVGLGIVWRTASMRVVGMGLGCSWDDGGGGLSELRAFGMLFGSGALLVGIRVLLGLLLGPRRSSLSLF